MYELLAIFALFILAYSAVSGGIARTPISGAIIFTTFGFIAGPLVFDWLDLDVSSEGLRGIAELTLAVLLFTDASSADLSVLRRAIKIPQRLLLVGLPLTILLGFLSGWAIFPELGLLELAILATVLAPTDAALGAAVVADESVPDRIRQGLNVESGLNDGICVPILFLFLALIANTGTAENPASLALLLIAEEIGIGMLVGGGLTFVAVHAYQYCYDRGWTTKVWQQLPVIALAVSCFSIAQHFGGSGFIASFVGGLTYSALARSQKEEFLVAAESAGDALALITWILFGAAVVGDYIGLFSFSHLLYALLSLTVIRMLPVIFSLTGTGLTFSEKTFIGWFGPRGMASIVFGVIVLGANLPNSTTIINTVVLTIILSVLLHGLSANPLIAALFRKS